LVDVAGAITMLLAGLLTSLSPCLFPVLPAYLMYAARRASGAIKVTLAFTAAMAASLAAYAFAASAAGYALVSWLRLSPSDAALLLSTIFLALALAQLTPAKELGSMALRAPPSVKKLDAAGAAALGALFALLAAPCASAPLLALAAKAALDPSSALPSIIAFSAGAALPFLAIGATAQSVGPRLHRSVSRSVLVKRSNELVALLFAAYGAMGLWATGDPLVFIERALPLLREAAPWLWGGALAASAWVSAHLRGGGRVTKWASAATLASLVGWTPRCARLLPINPALLPPQAPYSTLLEYALLTASFGLLPALIAVALETAGLRRYGSAR
jgi:cytochrome c biogenesis protein CcdA